MIWLVVVLAVAIVVGVAAGWLWGIVAALATLAVSEFVERARRQRLRQARGAEGSPLREAIATRRRRR